MTIPFERPVTLRIAKARFESACPQCKRPIVIGMVIAVPVGLTNRAGGNAFPFLRYCPVCADYLGSIYGWAPFLDDKAREAWDTHVARKRKLYEERLASGMWELPVMEGVC